METTDLSLERKKREQEIVALDEIIVLSRGGRDFYLHAARESENLAIKETFKGMAEYHLAMVMELESIRVSDNSSGKTSKRKSQAFNDKVQRQYYRAIDKINGVSDYELLDEVENNGGQILKTIRSATRKIQTKDIRRKLAAKIAFIQMDCDRIRTLRDTKQVHWLRSRHLNQG